MTFGTDGIRGIAYETLPLKIAFQLGYAIRNVFVDKDIYIGHDPRASSLDYVKALSRGLSGHQKEVFHVGMVTTPMLAWFTKEKKAIGIMVTASHNPYTDNGLKVLIEGHKLDQASEQFIAQLMTNHIEDEGIEVILKSLSIEDEYIKYLNQEVPLHTTLDYGIDCANGASSNIVKKALHGTPYYDQPSGYNINLNCGATNLNSLFNISKRHDVAFSYDGDGDRLMMSINDQILDGNMIIYLLFKANYQLGSVALSIMTNPGIKNAFIKAGATIIETPVGDKYLHDALHQGALMGAESSGHIVLKKMPFGDAIYMTRLMLQLIDTMGMKRIINWIHEVELVPMKTLNLKINKELLEKKDVQDCLNQLKTHHPKDHTWIIRPSGTESLIRVTLSHHTEKELDQSLQKIEKCFKGGLS